MEDLSFKCAGTMNFPVSNESEAFELLAELRYAVGGQAEIIDEARYKETEGKEALKRYMQANMPKFLKEALHVVWGYTLPLKALARPTEPMNDVILQVTKIPLSQFGLRLVDATVIILAIREEDRETLIQHEDPAWMARKAEEIDVGHFNIDVCYKPMPNELSGGATPAPVTCAPWKCDVCGMENITSRFCPQCGSPNPTNG